MNPKTRRIFPLELTENERKLLDKLSKERGMSKSFFIRSLIKFAASKDKNFLGNCLHNKPEAENKALPTFIFFPAFLPFFNEKGWFVKLIISLIDQIKVWYANPYFKWIILICIFVVCLFLMEFILKLMEIILKILQTIVRTTYQMIIDLITEHKSKLFLRWVSEKYKEENFRKNKTNFDEVNQVRPRDLRNPPSRLLVKPGESYDVGYPIVVFFVDLEKVFPQRRLNKIFPQTDHKIREKVFKILVERKKLYVVKSVEGKEAYRFDRMDNPKLFNEKDPLFRYGLED